MESIARCLRGDELVKALMERVIAAEEEKATLSRKVEELSRAQKDAGTFRKQNELVCHLIFPVGKIFLFLKIGFLHLFFTLYLPVTQRLFCMFFELSLLLPSRRSLLSSILLSGFFFR